MRVIGIAGADLQLLEQAFAKVDVAAHVGAVLAQADVDGFRTLFLDLGFAAFFLALVVACAGADRDTVESVVDAEGHAEARLVAEEGKAAIGRPGFRAAVEQLAFGEREFAQFLGFTQIALFLFLVGIGEQIGAQFGGQQEAGNAEVVSRAIGAVGMGDEAAT